MRGRRPDAASGTSPAPARPSEAVSAAAGASATASDAGITVEYFRKPTDPGTIERRLGALGYRVEVRAALDDGLTTNFLAFGSRVTHDDVRAIALALVESGVTLRAICRFMNDSGRTGDRSRTVQIIGSTLVARRDPIERATILGLAPDQPLPCR